MEHVLTEIAKQGVMGLVLALFVYLYCKERDRVQTLADKLYDLGTSMVKSNAEVKQVLDQVTKDVDKMRDDIRSSD